MNKKRLMPIICCLIALGLFAGGGAAYLSITNGDTNDESVLNVSTVAANHNLDSIIEHSDVIVSGTVAEVTKPIFTEDNPYSTSYVSVEVGESFKGRYSKSDTVIVEINSYNSNSSVQVEHQADDPVFAIKDDVLIFLVENDHGSYYVSGINQGAFYLTETTNRGDSIFKHRTIIGNDVESLTRSELMEKLIER